MRRNRRLSESSSSMTTHSFIDHMRGIGWGVLAARDHLYSAGVAGPVESDCRTARGRVACLDSRLASSS